MSETTYKTKSDDGRIELISASTACVIVACATCGARMRYAWSQTDREDYANPRAFAEYCLENAADNTAEGGEDEHHCAPSVEELYAALTALLADFEAITARWYSAACTWESAAAARKILALPRRGEEA